MINHIRTLLLNRDGRQTSAFGEELVPEDYRQIPLPTGLQTVDTTLFGARADRACRNYRLRQILPLLHNSPLADHLLVLDSRISYDQHRPVPELPVFPTLVHGEADTIRLFGEPPVNEESGGRMDYQWIIDVIDDSPSRISINGLQYTLTFSGAWSDPIQIEGTRLKVSLPEDPTLGDSWTFAFLSRPTVDLGVLAARLRSIGDIVGSALFGPVPAEPYKSFQNASQSLQVATCLSGFSLALAHRLEELRRA